MRPRVIFLALAGAVLIPLAVTVHNLWSNWHCVEAWYYCARIRQATEFDEAFRWRAKLLREPGADARLRYAFGAIGANADGLSFWILALHGVGFRHIYDEAAPEAQLTRHLTEAFLRDPAIARRYATLTMWLEDGFEALDDTEYIEADDLWSDEVLRFLAIRFALTGHDDLVFGLRSENTRDREVEWLLWFRENSPYLVWHEPTERWVIDVEAKATQTAIPEERRVASITVDLAMQDVDIAELRRTLRIRK
jgi:hypothetical protein